MNQLAVVLLWTLVRTGLVLTASAVLLAIFLRTVRIASPTLRRTAYFAVILQGCLFVQGPLAFHLPNFVTEATTTVGDALDRPQQASRRATGARLEKTPNAVARTDQGETLSRPDASVPPPTSGQPPPAAFHWAFLWAFLWAFPWALALAALWAAGIVVLVVRSAWIYARFVRQLPRRQNVESEWSAEWDAVQQQAGAGLAARVPLLAAEETGPVLCRLPGGYRLILPARAWRTLEPAQRQLVLRHELAHIERRDVWKSLAVRLLALVHWYHPLVWRLVRQFDECAEWACDDAIRKASPDCSSGYARALLQLAQRAEPIFFATRAVGAARDCGLSHRIRRLLTPAEEKGSKMKTALLATLLLGITLLNATRLQSRADAPPAATKETGHTTKESVVYPHGAPHEARVDLSAILTNMREFQREQQKFESALRAAAKTRANEEEAIRSANERILQEKDPLLSDLLKKGIEQTRKESARRRGVETAKLVAQRNTMYRTLYEKIAAEIARYAKSHDILVVRRSDRPGRPEGAASRRWMPAWPASPPYAAPGPRLVVDVPAGTCYTMARSDQVWTTATLPAVALAVANPPLAPLLLPPGSPLEHEPWSEELIYVVGRYSTREIDISEEIVKGLNAADVKKQAEITKQTDLTQVFRFVTQVFSFYVGLTR